MANNIHPVQDRMVSRLEREERNGHRGGVFWLTGLSGSGKSTIALAAERELFITGRHVTLLDGDNLRSGLNQDLGFSLADRAENTRRIAEVAKLFVQNGAIVLCAFVSPTRTIRERVSQLIGDDDFYEVFIDAPLGTCECRDVKGLYAKARRGEIKGFTGIDSPYEAPAVPWLTLTTHDHSPEASASALFAAITAQLV